MNFENGVINLSYDDIEAMCQELNFQISGECPTLIVGIKRGGLFPAVSLSHSLNVPMESLTWQTRDGDNVMEISQKIKDTLKAHKIVAIVDDINDSGKTLNEVVNYYKQFAPEGVNQIITAVMVEKSTSSFTADFYGLRLDDPRWVMFPYE